MDNVIAQVYVIESKDFGVEPIIYLNKPHTNHGNEKLWSFTNPFAAKNFIKHNCLARAVVVTKERHSQLALVIG